MNTVEDLRLELNDVRDDLLALTPFAEQFRKYSRCNNHHDLLSWWYETIKIIITSTTPDPELSNDWVGQRARCPLCGYGNSWHDNGFSLPDGLKRHLEGRSNAHQCHIMKHADRLGHDYVTRKMRK